MMNEFSQPAFHFYQSANADVADIKAGFIVRLKEFDLIMDTIRRGKMEGSVQHFLILGRRGSGKSTLLKRIELEIKADAELKNKIVVVNPAEEQAGIYRLFDLLEEIVKEMRCQGLEVTETETAQVPENGQAYTLKLFAAIHAALYDTNKTILLLADNIDRIFENIREDASLLREFLLNFKSLRIIGGSTRMSEHFWKYDQPFYQFFRIIELGALSREEVNNLLQYWGEKYRLPELPEFIKEKPGQLETIRLLTDGLPRTLQFFVNVIINRKEQYGYDYLRRIMDYMSPLYQEKLNNLSPAHRKIAMHLAFIWEAATVKQIAEAARMPSRLVSANLKQLYEYGVVDKLETANKNHLYRLSERFFNLWLIFTQGNPEEKRRARYLTVFLESFYAPVEIREITARYGETLLENSIKPNFAALFTKALAQSKFIGFRQRDTLINRTKKIKGIDKVVVEDLPLTTFEILNKAGDLVRSRQLNEAIQLIESIEQANFEKLFAYGLVFLEANKPDQAARFFIESAQSSEGVLSIPLLFGLFYEYNWKPQCLKLFNSYKHELNTIKGSDLPIRIKIWLNLFDGLDSEIAEFITSPDNSVLKKRELIKEMLIHHQEQVIINKLQDIQLKEEFLPLYYAALILCSHHKTKETYHQIPPELHQPVQEILVYIKERRAFYYPEKKPGRRKKSGV